jgi:hypothetical protein
LTNVPKILVRILPLAPGKRQCHTAEHIFYFNATCFYVECRYTACRGAINSVAKKSYNSGHSSQQHQQQLLQKLRQWCKLCQVSSFNKLTDSVTRAQCYKTNTAVIYCRFRLNYHRNIYNIKFILEYLQYDSKLLQYFNPRNNRVLSLQWFTMKNYRNSFIIFAPGITSFASILPLCDWQWPQ